MRAQGETFPAIFLERVRSTPEKVAMRYKKDGAWQPITWAAADRTARSIAGALIASGVGEGDKVTILSVNRPEWHLADWGACLAAAVPVGIYATNSAEQVAYVAGHCEAKVLFVEDADQLRKVVKVLDQLPHLEHIVLMSGRPDELDPKIVTWDRFLARGAAYNEDHPAVVDARARSVRPEDVLTIVYTSGTTGPPKGAMLTNANAVSTAAMVDAVLPLDDENGRIVSYLPLAHIFERLTSDWGSVFYGYEVSFAESIAKLADNLREVRPTLMIGVPRVYEKFYAKMAEAIASHPKRAMIERAVASGRALVEHRQDGGHVPITVALKHALFDRLVLRKLRHEAGLDQLRFAVTGAAPINQNIIWFIRSIGVDLIEGYGMTETTAVVSIPSPGAARIGTVGPPLAETDVRIDGDGEVLVRGPNIFKGYFKDEEATRAAMTDDGFLRTGDVGRLDSHGYLLITDRKKDLIITAGGKNIAPQLIEEQLKFSPLISQAIVIGDERAYVSALMTPDAEAVAKWAAEHGMGPADLAELTRNDALLAEIERWVKSTNARLSHVEQVKRWALLDRDFEQETGELTPTIKVRRSMIMQRYADQIELLYR